MTKSPEVEPPVADDSGYRVTQADLAFLKLKDEEVASWQSRSWPLGMSADIYEEFSKTLWFEVLQLGGDDADVRLQGSSARFFSGRHKRMPYERAQIMQEYMEDRGGTEPSGLDLTRFESAMSAQWPPSNRPVRRPFDALPKLGVHATPSDYDVQISSDNLVNRIIGNFEAKAGAVPQDFRVDDPHYGYVKKMYVTVFLPRLKFWEESAQALTGRPVSIALFDGRGPKEIENLGSDDMSSHFRPDDWIIPSIGGR